jgi:hypothetical protein
MNLRPLGYEPSLALFNPVRQRIRPVSTLRQDVTAAHIG